MLLPRQYLRVRSYVGCKLASCSFRQNLLHSFYLYPLTNYLPHPLDYPYLPFRVTVDLLPPALLLSSFT